MKKKPGFNLRTICGETILVAEGIENIDFSKIISMNESSAYLWQKVADEEITAERLASLLEEEYDVDYTTALSDSRNLIDKWIEAGIIA